MTSLSWRTAPQVELALRAHVRFIDWAMSWLSLCLHIDGIVKERRNSSALAMELRLPYTNPSILPKTLLYPVISIQNVSFDILSNNDFEFVSTHQALNSKWLAKTDALTYCSLVTPHDVGCLSQHYNGLVPIRRPAISWISAALNPYEQTSVTVESKYKYFIE